jgi:hypothetical protein
MANLRWGPIIAEAARIVESYDTAVSLRQLFYQLVSRQLIPNMGSKYHYLSRLTAENRRNGTFPALVDRTSEIHHSGGYESPGQAVRSTARYYRRDRADGQPWTVYLVVEKAGMVSQLQSWFARYSFTIAALSGYASQPDADDIVADVEAQGRPAVLFYAGDHDPTGWDIERDFIARTDCWDSAYRIALDPELITQYDLPESVEPEVMDKLERDPRARAFVARWGSLVQVELDALAPDVLRQLYQNAIFGDAIQPGGFWDQYTFDAVITREAEERAALIAFADEWQDDA